MSNQHEVRFTTAENFFDVKPPLDFTNEGKCTGCGECCGNCLPMTLADVNAVWNAASAAARKPLHDKLWYVCNHVGNVVDMTCPFCDDEQPNGHKCVIYESRPYICREYICKNALDGVYSKDFIEHFVKNDVRMIMVRETFFDGTNLLPLESVVERFLVSPTTAQFLAFKDAARKKRK